VRARSGLARPADAGNSLGQVTPAANAATRLAQAKGPTGAAQECESCLMYVTRWYGSPGGSVSLRRREPQQSVDFPANPFGRFPAMGVHGPSQFVQSFTRIISPRSEQTLSQHRCVT
jgi:hypothetical protein